MSHKKATKGDTTEGKSLILGLFENEILKLFSTSVLRTVTLCNCATKTRNHFIYAQVLFH